MKSHTARKNKVIKKSSFTLPLDDVRRVAKLKKRLKISSNTQVMKLALTKLEESTDREWLKAEFKRASLAVRSDYVREMAELGGDIEDEVPE